MTPKDQYEARKELKRIARGDGPNDEAIMVDLIIDLAERFVLAVEGIEMNMRGSKP